jgi:hypothetical protein
VLRDTLVPGSTYKMGFAICFDPTNFMTLAKLAKASFGMQLSTVVPLTLSTAIGYPLTDLVNLETTNVESVNGASLLVFVAKAHLNQEDELAVETFLRLFYTNGLAAVPAPEAGERMMKREGQVTPYFPVSWWNRFYRNLSDTLACAYTNDDVSPFQTEVGYHGALIIPGSNFAEVLAAGVYFEKVDEAVCVPIFPVRRTGRPVFALLMNQTEYVVHPVFWDPMNAIDTAANILSKSARTSAVSSYLKHLKKVRPLADFEFQVESPRKPPAKAKRNRFDEEDSIEEVYPTQTVTQTVSRYF